MIHIIFSGRTRTGSMSEDHKKPFKSILRNSPYLSKEDISQSNEVLLLKIAH